MGQGQSQQLHYSFFSCTLGAALMLLFHLPFPQVSVYLRVRNKSRTHSLVRACSPHSSRKRKRNSSHDSGRSRTTWTKLIRSLRKYNNSLVSLCSRACSCVHRVVTARKCCALVFACVWGGGVHCEWVLSVVYSICLSSCRCCRCEVGVHARELCVHVFAREHRPCRRAVGALDQVPVCVHASQAE